MTSYNAITDDEIASNKPVTTGLTHKLRDNLLAMLEGDPTAPFKIPLVALATVPGQNTAIYNSAGTSTYVVPAGVSSLEVDATGGGGATAPMPSDSSNWNGGGCGERRLARIAVTPGESLTIICAAVGGDSFVKRGATILIQAKGATGWPGGAGGYGGVGFGGATGWQRRMIDGSPTDTYYAFPGSPHGGNEVSNGASDSPGLVIIRC